MHVGLAYFVRIGGPDVVMGLITLFVIVAIISLLAWFRRKSGAPR